MSVLGVLSNIRLRLTVVKLSSGGVCYTIAEILAHLSFWQDWFHARCTSQPAPIVSSAADGWPKVAPGSWPEPRSRFLDRLQQLAGTWPPPAGSATW